MGVEMLGKAQEMRTSMSDPESFGVREIDELLGGGVIPGATYIVEFEQGTEEYALVVAYLNEALRKVELTSLVVFDLPYQHIMKNLEKFGFNYSRALNSGSMLVSDLYKEVHTPDGKTGPIYTSGDLKNPGAILEHYNMKAAAIEGRRIEGKFSRTRSVLISLSSYLMNFKFDDAYRLLRAGNNVVKEKGEVALGLLNSEMFDKRAISAFESLCDGVILLTLKDIDGKFQRFIRVKKSPLPNFYSEEVPYDIVGNSPSFPASFGSPPTLPTTRSEIATLDDVSRKILSELQKDGRKTYEELGKDVGYTGMAIKKRMTDLSRRGLIKVSALLNVPKMNMCLAATLLEVASAEELNLLVNRLKNCPRVVNMFTTVGGYNTIVMSVAEDQDTLQSFSLKQFSLQSNKGIKRADYFPVANAHYSAHFLVRNYFEDRKADIAPCRSNCRTCQRYQDNKCVGCPATRWYKGNL